MKSIIEKKIASGGIKTVRDIVIMLIALFIAYKVNKLDTKEAEVITKQVLKVIEVPVIETKTNKIFLKGDTTIYINTVKEIVKDSFIRDTFKIYVSKDSKLFQDSLKIDSVGTIYGFHILDNDSLTSVYDPHISIKEKTIEKTIYKNPLRLYSNIQTDFNSVSTGFTLTGMKIKNQDIEFGTGYDFDKKTFYIRSGINLLKF